MYEKLLNPVFSNLKGRENYINGITKRHSTFSAWSREIMQSHQDMIELAKWYIRNHWEEVDWKDFSTNLGGRRYTNEPNEAYPKGELGVILKGLDDRRIRFDDIKFSYDDTDCDLLIYVDGDGHLIDDESVLDAVLYLEDKK